jgi:hypothetical protein
LLSVRSRNLLFERLRPRARRNHLGMRLHLVMRLILDMTIIPVEMNETIVVRTAGVARERGRFSQGVCLDGS